MRLIMIPAAAAAVFVAAALAAAGGDPDADRDGLSDFQEIHKHLTDPANADSDGDGIPDGKWDERREYAYTVRCVLYILPPCDPDAMNDDYQDARILERRDDYVKAEVILYPYNTCGAEIPENPTWRADYASMKKDLKAGVTTNWDRKMQSDLLAALAADGIEVAALSDREAAKQVAAWLCQRAPVEDSFTTFAAVFAGKKAKIAPGLKENVEAELARRGRTIEEQWDRELFGRGMFYNKVRGSCTSSAIYLAAGLKAVGLPARTVVCLPVPDASDESERTLIAGLTNHRVRQIVEEAAEKHGQSWTSHTFNEVYVGGRWRRLNYERLGQNILDPKCLGVMVHVNTFADHANAGLVTWGLRNAGGGKGDVFGHANPYSYVELSDEFGRHCTLSNPQPGEGLRELTISRIYWYDDENKPAAVQMQLDEAEPAGHLVIHVDEGDPFEGPSQYAAFYEGVGKKFTLRAAGHPEIRARATRGYWTDVPSNVMDFYLRIDPDDYARMARGVPYELAVASGGAGEAAFRWRVRPGVSIVRPEE